MGLILSKMENGCCILGIVETKLVGLFIDPNGIATSYVGYNYLLK